MEVRLTLPSSKRSLKDTIRSIFWVWTLGLLGTLETTIRIISHEATTRALLSLNGPEQTMTPTLTSIPTPGPGAMPVVWKSTMLH